MSETAKSLVGKLSQVMEAIKHIPKRGHNDFHNYDYPTEADVADTVREQLVSRNVMLIPAIVGESRHPVGEKGSVLTVLEMEMEFYDADSGESIKKPWRGYGTDKEDKGGYKAMTGGEKYFLLKTFLIPTGDDPEADGAQPQQRQPAKREAPQRPPQAPQPAPRPQPAAAQPRNGSSLYVINAKQAKSGTNAKGPWTLHVIKFSDGREGKTFSKSVYSSALRAAEERLPVEATLNDKGDIGKFDLIFQQFEDKPVIDDGGYEPPPF